MARVADDGGLSREAGDASAVLGAFDQMPVMLMAMEGPDHRIAGANAACRAFLGRSGLVGMPVRAVLPEIAGQQIFEMLDRVYATGEAQQGREWRVQLGSAAGGTREAYVDFRIVPWRGPDGLITGVLASFGESTEQVLQRQEVQRQAAEAERRFLAARGVVAELQEALLPPTVPVLPWARIAARYLVAGQDQSAGGDWFDAIPLPDGTVALIVGDVVGHGVAASAAMAQLRAVLNERLLAEADLIAVIAQADAFAARNPALYAATMAVAVLDPGTGQLRYITCGHPPPLLIGSGGVTRFLPGSGAGPLGTGSRPVLATATLQPGELILLYSDGLIERPNRTLEEGRAELSAVAADAAANLSLLAGTTAATAAERVCQLTVELLTRTGYDDDVTTLAAQRLVAPVTALSLELPAEPASLHLIKDSFDAWLRRIDPLEDDRGNLRLAIIEIVTNAIAHAYRPGQPGPIAFRAYLRDDGYLECDVTDQGRWRAPEPAPAGGGNGLMIAEHAVDHLEVRPPRYNGHQPGGAPGTVALLRHRLRRPAVLASDASAQPARRRAALPFAVDLEAREGAGAAAVRGPVDATTAQRLSSGLMTACHGGTVPLTIDLNQVTYLASAGVRILYQIRDQLQAHHQELTIHATAGSPAGTVLDLVKLPRAS
jgi:anti-anti-sigma factor